MAVDKKIIIDYTCYNCKAQFPAPQGSLKRYCPECMSKAVARELPDQKGNGNTEEK
jgi:DNA-directed RNA polymerase subunit RPC12/RpoP